MRVKKATIPSAFIKLDTNVTAADNCVNAHDQHVFRQNHNALLAKRVRKDLVSQAIGAPGLSPSTNFCRFTPRYSANGEATSRVMSIPLYVTQHTQELRFWCVACKSGLDASSTLSEDPELYVVVHEPQVETLAGLLDNSITVTAATSTPTAYSVDVPLPSRTGEHTHHMGRVPWIMDVYIKTYIDDTYAMHSAVALTDIGRDWFSTAGISVNHIRDVVYTDTSHVEPRQIVRDDVFVGKFWIDKPWTEIPTTSATITVREVLGVDMYSWGVQELAVTRFTMEHAI